MADGRPSLIVRSRRGSRRGRAAPDPRDRRHGHLVAEHFAEGIALGRRRPARHLDLHPLAGIPRGRIQPSTHPLPVPDRRRVAPPQGGGGGRHRPGCGAQKNLIEAAYRLGKAMGLSVWCTDQAGPFQTIPSPGQSWRPEGDRARQPHEYLRDDTAKVLTLFHPADGRVHVRGRRRARTRYYTPGSSESWARSAPHCPVSLRPSRPSPGGRAGVGAGAGRSLDQADSARGIAASTTTPVPGQPGRSQDARVRLPALRARHHVAVHSGGRVVAEHGRERPANPQASGIRPATARIIAWFEAVAEHWNSTPTPFICGGKRATRRQRKRERRHRLETQGPARGSRLVEGRLESWPQTTRMTN